MQDASFYAYKKLVKKLLMMQDAMQVFVPKKWETL